jgi:glycosyltransferase involved in cell wall biosynthesis
LVVQPYRNATQSGIAQIAYHFEKPMLITNVGGLAEIVLQDVSGVVVEPNPISIYEGLVHFFKIEKDWTEGVRSQKKRFSWENLVNAIEALYCK